MAYQLWVSPLTGYRRKGTRFSSLKKLFVESLTVREIYEPLLCCQLNSSARVAKEALTAREFDVAGVKESEEGDVIGFIITNDLNAGELKDYLIQINPNLLISDSTPISELFYILLDKEFTFVLSGNQIAGIITKADINKPSVRIYLFGLTSLFEMHLNLWVNTSYPENTWIEKVSRKRMEKAKRNFEQRKGNNQDLSLLDCLQLCDKRNLLEDSDRFLKSFGFAKESYHLFVEDIEILRNELAHSQESIISNLEWARMVEIIGGVEKFLSASDEIIEDMAAKGNGFQDVLVPSV